MRNGCQSKTLNGVIGMEEVRDYFIQCPTQPTNTNQKDSVNNNTNKKESYIMKTQERTMEEKAKIKRAKEIITNMASACYYGVIGDEGSARIHTPYSYSLAPAYEPDPLVLACPVRMWRFAQALAEHDEMPCHMSEETIKNACKEAMSKPVKTTKSTAYNRIRKQEAMQGHSAQYINSTLGGMRRSNRPIIVIPYSSTDMENYGCINRNEYLMTVSRKRRLALGIAPYGGFLSNSGNYFSVEIEFIATESSPILGWEHGDWDLASNGDVKFVGDGSVNAPGDGFALARYQEVRINCRWGKVSKLYKICHTLAENGATVNKTCGLHVHLDSRHLSRQQEYSRRKRLVAALKWLLELVPVSRRDNHFCMPNNLAAANRRGRSRRFQAINPTSYSKHGTTEIRLGAGSVDPDKILNWATLLKFIADNKKKLPSFALFLSSAAPEHVKIWAVLRRNKFSPALGNTAEGSEG